MKEDSCLLSYTCNIFFKEKARAELSGSAHHWCLPPWSGVYGSHRSNPTIGPLWLLFSFLVYSCCHQRFQPAVVYLTSFFRSLHLCWAPLILMWLAWWGGPVCVFYGWYTLLLWGRVLMVGHPCWWWAGFIDRQWYSLMVGLTLSMGGCLHS